MKRLTLLCGVMALGASLAAHAQRAAPPSDVNVVNDTLSVRDTDRPGKQPLVGKIDMDFGISQTLIATLAVVPVGKQGILEHLSCIDFIDSANNNFVRFDLEYTSGGVVTKAQFLHTNVGTSFVPGIDVVSFSQPFRAYVDGGSNIVLTALRRTTTGLAGIECYLNGYLVDD